MNTIGRRGGVKPPEAGAERGEGVGDLLQWVIGLGGTAVLLAVGSTIVLRMRREILATSSGAAGSVDDLMETVREAYFEGELDTEEYQDLRRRLNPAARDESPPPTGDPQAG